MRKKAIVTGATGFVGSNLCRKLINEKWDVSIIIRQSSNYSNLEDVQNKLNIFVYDGNINKLIHFFRNEKAEVVFHLASSSVVEHKPEQVEALIDSNLTFGLQLLEAMKESETKLMVNTGTYWQHYHTHDYNPVNLYAATKEAFEKLIKYYIESENIRVINLKLFDTYGETDQRPKLINLLNKYADEKKTLSMSPGEQVIDLVHVDDVTNAFIKASEFLSENEQVKYKEFGIGTGNPINLKELILLFEKVTGKKLDVIWGGREYRKREVMKLWNNYDLLPNWESKIELKEGLLRYKEQECKFS